jgi:hypothetical protein
MRRSSMLGSLVRSGLFTTALVALSAAGCGKEQAPGTGTESPVKEPQAAGEQAKAPDDKAMAKDPSAPSPAAEGAGSQPEAQGGSQAKVDPNRPAPAKGAPGQPEPPHAGIAVGEPAPGATGAVEERRPDPAAPAPTSAAGDSRTAEVTSPKVGEANFSVWMQAAGKHKVGQQGTVEVVLIPKNGFHCNENYPYKIKLNDPPSGVSFPQAVVRKENMSVTPDRGVMRVPFVPTAAGDARISGKFSFSVCTSDQCLIDSRDLAIVVKVE